MKSTRMMLLVAAVAVNVPVVAMAQAKAKAPAGKAPANKQVARGEFLVKLGACNDCHTPLVMGPQGPERDMTHMLSGHPEQMKLPPAPSPQGPWIFAVDATYTAWSGPWGVSYPMNLTQDKETGLGNWTEQNFIQAMHTGKHMGQGRPILPPMPWQTIGQLPDEDLKAIFAYLKTVPAVKNKISEPTPPAGGPPGGAPAGGPPAGGPPGGAPPGGGAPAPKPGGK